MFLIMKLSVDNHRTLAFIRQMLFFYIIDTHIEVTHVRLFFQILQSLLFLVGGMVFSTITSMPFTVYSTFVLEEKHGFNKQVNCFSKIRKRRDPMPKVVTSNYAPNFEKVGSILLSACLSVCASVRAPDRSKKF